MVKINMNQHAVPLCHILRYSSRAYDRVRHSTGPRVYLVERRLLLIFLHAGD